MSSIFDKYKPTSTAVLKKSMQEEDEATNYNKRSDRLELADGLNKVRFGPAHPGESNFMHIHGCHWISLEKESGEMGRRTVPNARLHAGVKVDPIELYVEFCKIKLATGNKSDSDKLTLLTDYEKGLNLSSTWISYAKLIKGENRGAWELFEYKRSVRDSLKSAMIIEDEDEAIETDPFTDPLTGRAVLITKNLKAKNPKDKYKVQTTEKKSPISEEELIAYDKLTPISKLSDLNYTMKDFENAVLGIQNYDEENDIGLADDEEFLEQLEAVKKDIKKALSGSAAKDVSEESDEQAPFETDDEEDTKPKAKAQGFKGAITKKAAVRKPVVQEQEEEDVAEEAEEVDEVDSPITDKFTKMERHQLVAYKTKQGWDGIVKIYKTEDDDTIRQKLRDHEASQADDSSEDAEEEAETVVVTKAATKTTGGKINMADIKAKLNKNKK